MRPQTLDASMGPPLVLGLADADPPVNERIADWTVEQTARWFANHGTKYATYYDLVTLPDACSHYHYRRHAHGGFGATARMLERGRVGGSGVRGRVCVVWSAVECCFHDVPLPLHSFLS